MIRRYLLNLTVSLAVVAAAACGSDKASPTAPSVPTSTGGAPAPAPPPSGVAPGATISGMVIGFTGITSANHRLAGGMTVSVSGTSLSSPVDASGAFALRGVPAGHVDLHFVGSAADAHLGLDDVTEHAEIHLAVHVGGSTVELEDDEREDSGKVEVEGRVTQVGAGSLRVGDATVTVPAGIPIRREDKAITLSDIHVGDRVKVRGTGTRTALTASRIEVKGGNAGQPVPAPKPDDDHGEAEVTGTVAGRSGTCPAISFKVGTTPVLTSGSTTFADTTCATLANGDTVEVKGAMSSGTLNATRVEKKK